MLLPVTSTVTAIFAIALVILGLTVSLRRISMKAVYGDAGDDMLRRRIRAHGNFIEYASIGLIALGLVEMHSPGAAILWVLAGLLLIGRGLHALGMFLDLRLGRMIGMVATHAMLLAAAGSLLAGLLS